MAYQLAAAMMAIGKYPWEADTLTRDQQRLLVATHIVMTAEKQRTLEHLARAIAAQR